MAATPTVTAPTSTGGLVPSPPRKSFSLRPAFLVLGLGLVMAILFGILNITSDPGTRSIDTSTAGHAVAGSSLRWTQGAVDLSPILQAGEPPPNIVNAVTIPQGSRVLGVIDTSAGASQYDESVRFEMATSQAQLISFFGAEMRRTGWSVTNVGAAVGGRGSVEVLAKKAGDDGWYWEQGVVISPTTFASASDPAPGATLTPSSAGNSTTYVLRLYQVGDETT